MSMQTDLYDAKAITILVDENLNIAIFPRSKSDSLLEDGQNYAYYVAYHPIESKSPYTVKALALAIQEGIEAWNKYPCYETFEGKNTFEEKYYGIKDFKKAIAGKKYIHLGWDDIGGKYVRLNLPMKSGYAYMGIESIRLPDDADYLDFAQAVIDLLHMDLSDNKTFKVYKSRLLL